MDFVLNGLETRIKIGIVVGRKGVWNMSKIGIIILAIFFLYVVFLFGVAINDDSEEDLFL